jgi:hypothetical protein
MSEEVKNWLRDRYRGYPIDIGALLTRIRVAASTSSNSGTDIATGNVTIGVGTKRTRIEYYSLILHELRHAVNYAWSAGAPEGATVESDMGPAMEGSGAAVEALLLEPFLRQTLRNELAYRLYVLHYAIRDARFVGTTAATLARYFRRDCSRADDPDTLAFTKAVAMGDGLTDEQADVAALRAHVGTNYFQYIFGGLRMLRDIAYLQDRIDPPGKQTVDPFVLFACSLNNPRRDVRYVKSLQACMRLRR